MSDIKQNITNLRCAVAACIAGTISWACCTSAYLLIYINVWIACVHSLSASQRVDWSQGAWPSSHPPPASAEREEVAQSGNVTTYCGPSSDLFLQSKPNQLEDSSAGQPSLLLPSQESLGAPATEQAQDRPVLIIPAFVHPAGLTLYVHLPEMVTCRYAQSRHSLSAGCASKHASFLLTYRAGKPNLPCNCCSSMLSNQHGSTFLGYANAISHIS